MDWFSSAYNVQQPSSQLVGLRCFLIVVCCSLGKKLNERKCILYYFDVVIGNFSMEVPFFDVIHMYL
jgi:hypothetical protein